MAATLSVSDWKKQIKPYPNAADIGPVTKALEEYAKVGSKGDPDLALDALDDVIVRAKAAKKKNARDKAVVEILEDLIGDAEQELDTVARDAARNSPEDEDDDAAGDMLRSMLIRVKKVDQDKALPFVVALGTVPGMVIAKRPPLSRDHKNTARAMREGKGKLLMGQCFGEDGKFIFEFPDAPPGGLTKVIKKAAKLHANMEIRLKVRGGGAEIDDEADLGELTDFGTDGEDAAPAAAAPTPQVPAELFKARAKEVRAALDAVKAVDPGAAAPLMTEFATALGHAQAGRYDQARGLLEIIARRAGDAQRAAAAAKGGAAEPTDAGAGAPIAQVPAELFKARAKEVRGEIDALKAVDPGAAAPLMTEFATALGHAQAGRYDQARGLLEIIARRAGDAQRAAAAAKGGAEPKKSEAAAEFTNLLKDLSPRIKDAQAAGGAAANEVKLKISEANVFARKGEYDRGVAILKDLGGLLDRMPKPAGAAEKTNTVRLWVDARDKVVAQMNALQDAVIREGADTGDGDFELIAKQGLAAITKRLQVGLHVALLEFDMAPAGKKAGAGAKARAKINEFKAMLATNPMVRLAEKNPWGVKVEIRSVIAPTLDRLAAELSA